MDKAYVDKNKSQAVCCWNAPNMTSITDLFTKAGVITESIREVEEFAAEAA